jgi:aspartyl-tRNA(Asn)/glutamyl-tRNA(Gln) amidotransferase subunit B
VILVDEVLTPDSSRFWPAAAVGRGKVPDSFDKQFVRDWLEASGWDKASPPPELPAERRHRYADQLGLSQYDARVLTEERAMADYFEATVAAGADAKAAANWLSGDIAAHVNANRLSYDTLPLRPEQLAELVQLIETGTISGKIAKEILPELLEQGGSAKAIVEERGLGMISDPKAIEAIVEALLAAHPEEVEAFRGGKNKLQGFFVGQLMKQTGGKADPKLANQILNSKLKG